MIVLILYINLITFFLMLEFTLVMFGKTKVDLKNQKSSEILPLRVKCCQMLDERYFLSIPVLSFLPPVPAPSQVFKEPGGQGRQQKSTRVHFKKIFFGRTSWHAGSQFPDQGSNPCPPAVEVQSLNHWTTREFPPCTFLRLNQHPFFQLEWFLT